MAPSWPDIPGVTEVGGRPTLPRRPEPSVALLRAVCGVDFRPEDGVGLIARRTGADRARVEGLLSWLMGSGVVRVEGGGLKLHPDTSPHDLACRLGAHLRAGARDPEVRDRALALSEALRQQTVGDTARVGGTPWRMPDAVPPDEAAAEVPAATRRLQRLLAALDGAFLERSSQVRAVLLTLLAGRHVLLLGPPGTAKSMLARAVRGCVQEATYFEYLLSRFTHPDELFGPVSIPGLKEEDYRRLTEGYLPTAHVAFLDEVFKANSAILNSLLTLVNERVFHHGRHRDDAPLISLLGASNELPDPDGGLAALYDRFLVRVLVPPLESAEAFLSVATGRVAALDVDSADRLTLDDLASVRKAATSVVVPDSVQEALVAAWRHATEAGWQVSDRRWRQGIEMLRVAAASEGREAVSLLDLLLLEPVLAPHPERAAEVRTMLLEQVAPRAVPDHDLAVQWELLGDDRVRPTSLDDGLDLGEAASWDAALARRRRHAARMVAHANEAVERLAADRDAAEAHEHRLWIHRVPARVLPAHIEAARDLSRILGAAERYAAGLADGPSVLRALCLALPEPERRSFGAGVALRLSVPDADLSFGLTLAAERLDAPEPEPTDVDRRRVVEADLFERAPQLVLAGNELIGLLRGEITVDELVDRVPRQFGRNASTVLSRLARRLGGSGVPMPPALP